jgi:hypothetical protein
MVYSVLYCIVLYRLMNNECISFNVESHDQ